MIADADRRRLLQLARDAIVARVTGRPAPIALAEGPFAARGALFVTLHNGGQLRGCIGHLAWDQPFATVVPRCAIASAIDDPRFSAVTAEEIGRLEIEMSVLGPLEPIQGPADVEIGRHGLVVEQGWRRGLLLPQVAIEWNWDAPTFLAQTCHKAGLPLDAWNLGASIWRFEAEVFGEKDTESGASV